MSLFFIGCFPLAGPSLQLYGLVLSPSFQEVMVCGRGCGRRSAPASAAAGAWSRAPQAGAGPQGLEQGEPEGAECAGFEASVPRSPQSPGQGPTSPKLSRPLRPSHGLPRPLGVQFPSPRGPLPFLPHRGGAVAACTVSATVPWEMQPLPRQSLSAGRWGPSSPQPGRAPIPSGPGASPAPPRTPRVTACGSAWGPIRVCPAVSGPL